MSLILKKLPLDICSKILEFYFGFVLLEIKNKNYLDRYVVETNSFNEQYTSVMWNQNRPFNITYFNTFFINENIRKYNTIY